MTADEIKKHLEKLAQARDWCAKEFKKRNKGGLHPSFLADTLLKEASEKFQLEDHGVEGWSTSVSGKTGVQYLNYGDPYISTLMVHSRPDGVRFHVAQGGWADHAPDDQTEQKVARETRRRNRELLQEVLEREE